MAAEMGFWLRGLKTTYYLRTLGATHAEKSTTGKLGQLNAVQSEPGVSAGFAYGGGAATAEASAEVDEPKFCAIDDPDCEACQ